MTERSCCVELVPGQALQRVRRGRVHPGLPGQGVGHRRGEQGLGEDGGDALVLHQVDRLTEPAGVGLLVRGEPGDGLLLEPVTGRQPAEGVVGGDDPALPGKSG